jgi:hypothetical protein
MGKFPALCFIKTIPPLSPDGYGLSYKAEEKGYNRAEQERGWATWLPFSLLEEVLKEK